MTAYEKNAVRRVVHGKHIARATQISVVSSFFICSGTNGAAQYQRLTAHQKLILLNICRVCTEPAKCGICNISQLDMEINIYACRHFRRNLGRPI